MNVDLDYRRRLIVSDDSELSIRRQCELLGMARSSYYYRAVPVDEQELELMRLLDQKYIERPYFGVRRMTDWLHQQGHTVNHKRVRRLLRQMGIEAIYPKPRTSTPHPGHRLYPYLLRGVEIDRVNQVWSTDITYIPMARGFAYLVAVIDWYSRYVLSWKLSNTLDVEFCLSALDAALEQGTPSIFNSDQGAQFTSTAFTDRLNAAKIAISMDGRGRCHDNIFIERLWRSVKYEDIYLKDYQDIWQVEDGLTEYFHFYDHERRHQSLGYRTPVSVYLDGLQSRL
jgi:putative transposase